MTDAGLVGTIREIHHIKGRGRVVPTRLAGVGTLCGGDFSTVDVVLPKEMDTMEVPPGAEVWKPA